MKLVKSLFGPKTRGRSISFALVIVAYIVISIIMILCAGLRPVGFDRDSENYEQYHFGARKRTACKTQIK